MRDITNAITSVLMTPSGIHIVADVGEADQ